MKFSKSLIITAALLCLGAIIALAVTPEVPRVVAYQGYLTDAAGDPIADGAHVVQFHIWNDPVLTNPGNDRWWSGVTAVSTTDGLFDILLGEPGMNAMDPDIFVDSNLWLGVTLGADPELSPRTKLTTAPYAFNARLAQSATEAGHAASADVLTSPVDHGSLTGLADDDHPQYVNTTGDDMTGDLNIVAGSNIYATVNAPYGGFYQYDGTGNFNGRLHGDNWGQFQLWDGQVGNVNTIEINAQYSNGGEVIVRDASGSQTHRLDAGNTGNSSVVFPNDAISADETLEEPGIARVQNSSRTLSGGVDNITSRTITVPGPGYVVATAYGAGQIGGTTIGNILFYISTSASGAALVGDYTIFGSDDETVSSYTTRWGSLSAENTYAVGSAGSYTYYLNADRGYTNGTAIVYYSKLVLTYYPTNYGTVSTIAATDELDQFNQVTAIESMSGVGTSEAAPTTLYSVDLQELVDKAKTARAAAERAELELAEALARQNPASSAGNNNDQDQ